jgi:hypothetical protein
MDSFYITKEELFAYMAKQERLAHCDEWQDISDDDITRDVRGELALWLKGAMDKLGGTQ